MGYNLISVLKDISTKIGNIIVPDPNTQLSNIKTAIDNINIQAIATDSIAVDGSRWNPAGNYVADLDLFWEGLGHVNTSTLNHPQSNGHGIVIAARNGAGAIQIYIPIDAYTDNTDPTIYMRFTQYANLGNWVNPWDYLYLDSFYVKYNDPNNLGADNVHGAINALSNFTYGNLTINSTYATGAAFYQKLGKVVTVYLSDIVFIAQPAGGAWSTPFVSGLPKVAQMNGNPKIVLQPVDSSFRTPVNLAFGPAKTELFFHWTITSGVPANVVYNATFTYICE